LFTTIHSLSTICPWRKQWENSASFSGLFVYLFHSFIIIIIANQAWDSRMGQEDFPALTPLIYSHVSPYGYFKLDIDKRLFPERLKLSV